MQNTKQGELFFLTKEGEGRRTTGIWILDFRFGTLDSGIDGADRGGAALVNGAVYQWKPGVLPLPKLGGQKSSPAGGGAKVDQARFTW